MYEIILADWIEKVKSSNLSSKDQAKNILELCHVASFIMSLNFNGLIGNVNEVTIQEGIRESPDFISNYKGELIGLEIKQIKNNKREYIGRLKGLLVKSEKIFRQKYPNVNFLLNISFIDKFIFKSSEEVNLKEQIADYVYCIYNNEQCDKPDFIEDVFLIEHSGVSFNLSGVYIYSESLNSDAIEKIITENEHYIPRHKINTENKKVFLLLVVSMASRDSNFTDIQLPSLINTKFDSVFLLKDFYKEVFMIK
jgi:hypothetical protein